MVIYVDIPSATYGRMKMCHMVADNTDELLWMADTIGVARRWIQHAGTYRVHFDICMTKRALAVAAGAREITRRELARFLRSRR